MKTNKLQFPSAALVIAAAFSMAALAVRAQNCSLPDFPTGATTTTQDRDRMLCQLGITIPTLPPRLQDPNRPPNGFPRDAANPEGNWTDPRGHTVVRTAFGIWHTYDSDAGAAGGAQSPLGDYGPFSNPHYTPLDLLKMNDGTSIQTPEDWWLKRRPEVLSDIQNELYGFTPDRSQWPAITWSVGPVTTGTANGFAYRQKTTTGNIDISSYPALRNRPAITCTLRTPADKAGTKVPVFVVFGGTGAWQYTAPFGYGVCGFSSGALQPDSGGANLSSYIIGLMNKGNWRKPGDWGALAAWAWGISRLIDYFETDPDVDGAKIAVEGHSRFGKATLVTAMLDQRVAAAYASCGGSLGTAPARRHYGETLEFVGSSTSEYHWVAGNLMKYMGPLNPGAYMPRKVENLTVDSQSAVALVAPRPIMLNGGTDTPPGNGDAWQDPRGMFLTGLLANPVYELLGWKGVEIPPGTVFTSGPDESVGGTPPFDVAFITGNIGYRRHHEGHTDAPDWPTFVQFASKYLNDKNPVVTPNQIFRLAKGFGADVGKVSASDGDGDELRNWQITGGTGASMVNIDRSSGQLTLKNPGNVDFAATPSFTVMVAVSDGINMSRSEKVVVTGTVQVVATATLTKSADGSYLAAITLTNNGNATVQNVQLTSGTLGSESGSPAPQALGDIAPGGSTTSTMRFAASAGASQSTVIERYSGSYDGGTFVASIRAVLP